MTQIWLATALLTAIIMALTFAVMAARRVLAPSRPVEIKVNDSSTLPGSTGDKLLSILKAGDLPIPSPCGGKGTCGLCRVTVPSDAGEITPTELARLNRDEVAHGMRLACQTVVRGSLEVTVPDEFLSAETLTCKVKSSKMLAPLIKEIILDLPKGASFDPRPGSFVQVTAPPFGLRFTSVDVAAEHEDMWRRQGWRDLQLDSTEPVTRAYSMANTPADAQCVALTIRLAVPPPGKADVPPGIVSSWLFSLHPGDPVDISGPFGSFGAQNTDREMVFIGGGVGMAPLRSIIHDQLERVGTQRKMSYWYGARGPADAFYVSAFQALEKAHPNFAFVLGLSDPGPETAAGHVGFIHEIVLREYLSTHPAPEECEYYLCGPPLMIQAVRAMLDSLGVEDEMIFFDDFGG